ncbi:efflux transporter outer membrane subunit [Pseudodesulfovibrio sp. F-1]|uniref:Efflux transporter outer membrane subunit n=1 Tax=Pseudodesulfovibrio alkaliphilus TaxID=2661613 RepID=A0A7K1KLK7_9BACT|nr:efflux transporter outer membrane subunit [Pseudodesulfovibrio alkaliphilus]
MSPSTQAHLFFSVAASLVAALLVAGCTPFQPDPRDGMELSLPPAYTLYSEEPRATDRWWREFGSEELDALVEEGLSANLDIGAAWGRLRQARASAVQSGADAYPVLTGAADYAHTRSSGNARSETTSETHSVGLSAGYEVDFWGRVQAVSRAGELDSAASREDLNTVAMTVAAEIVTKWVRIQAQRQKKQILHSQITANRTYLELIELRFRNSLATALDVYQQRENVERVKAELPLVESEEQLLLHELALLLGRPVGTVMVADEPLPEPASLPGLGLPVDLLANRPDIRSSGLALQSADWTVAAARADRLPALTLGGDAAYSGAQLATLFNNWMFSLAASVVGPIFDGGSRAAEVEKARGVVDERLADYKATVLTALKEVEDALAQEKWQRRYIKARQAQVLAARVNLSEALSRYRQGLDDYLPVLTALFTVQELEVSAVGDAADLLLYRAALHRALGGSWVNDLVPSAPDGEEDAVQSGAAPNDQHQHNG